MPLPENIFILFYWTAPEAISFFHLYSARRMSARMSICTG